MIEGAKSAFPSGAAGSACQSLTGTASMAPRCGTASVSARRSWPMLFHGWVAPISAESARRIAQFSRASPGGKLARNASCGRPSVFDEKPRLLRIGGRRQDHVGPVRTTIPVRALVDHERPRGDVHLVRAQIVDHVRAIDRGGKPALGHRAHIHRAHARGGGVQDQKARGGLFGQFHRSGQHSLAIGLADRALSRRSRSMAFSRIVSECSMPTTRSSAARSVPM